MTLHVGHALEVLRTLPDASVHCCVTSPPYFGLRDYGLEPFVWGGDPDCSHEWGAEFRVHRGGPPGKKGALVGGSRAVAEAQRKVKDYSAGTFCECGAWRGQLGLEPDHLLFVEHLVSILEEVRRVLRDDGTLWLNLGDTYAGDGGAVEKREYNALGKNLAVADVAQPNRKKQQGLKPKDMCGIPWRVAFALQDAGWWLRSEIIWEKPTPMPASLKDRPTTAHEQIFLLAKSKSYYYDRDAAREPCTGNAHPRGSGVNPKAKIPSGWDTGSGHHKARKGRYKQNASFSAAVTEIVETRNWRTVWRIQSIPYKPAHFATFPPELARRCIVAGCPEGGVVLDPFMGSGTVAAVAEKEGRRWIGIEASEEYAELVRRRVAQGWLF